MKDPLFWWLGLYVFSGLLWLSLAQDFNIQGIERWRPRLAALGLFYSVALLSSEARRGLIALVIVACVVLACATTWFDILRPFRIVPREFETAQGGRGAGLFINPNVAGSFIAAATIVALPFVPMRLRGALIVCAAVGIVPTFSRSSYIYAVMLLVLPMALRMLDRTQAAFVLIVVPLLTAATAASYDFLLEASDDRNLHNVVRRLEWFRGLEPEDQAVEGRLYGAAEAWRMFLDAPLMGKGLGATMAEAVVAEGPHNMYLMLMGEQGLLGLAFYLLLLAIFFRRGRWLMKTAADDRGRDVGRSMLLFAAMLFFWGFFDHNVLEQPFTMFLIGFIAAAAHAAPRSGAVYVAAPASAFPRRQRAANVTPRMGQL
jgi:O-antigen ligase